MPGKYLVNKAIELEALSAKSKAALATNQNWLIAKKYDGCHALFEFQHGKFLRAFSRTGEPVTSMDHVGHQLAVVFDYIVASPHKVVIDGEAWTLGDTFNVISGNFRRQAPCPSLSFVPFDVLEYNDKGELRGRNNWPYHMRVQEIREAQVNQPAWCGAVYKFEPLEFYGPLEDALIAARSAAEFFANTGFYDGAILANAVGIYEVGAGREGNFVKIKPLQSYTVTVTGAALDFGTKTGKNTAALKFMLDGREQKVSTGLTQEQVDEIARVGWDGYRIEVEAMGKTINGFLREPRFKGIRTDA